MKLIYILLFCTMLLGMNLLRIKSRKTHHPMVKVTGYLTLTVNITILSSLLAAFLPMKEVALFMQCVQYATTEWCLIALLRFMEEYTKSNYARRWTRITFCVLTGMSNLSLLLNCVFHHVVTNRLLTISNDFTCFVYDNQPGYLIHFYYCAFLALCNVTAMATKTIKSPGLYRKKYLIPLLMVLFALGSECLYSILDNPLDYSLLVYIVLSIFLNYYAIFYTPKTLINNTLSYVVKDSSNGIVCFDNENKCIYANEEAMLIFNNPSDYAVMERAFDRAMGGNDYKNMEEISWEKVYTMGELKKYYEISFHKLYDQKQNYIGCFFFICDKTEDVSRYVKERYLATHDTLTQLFNKNYFYESVQRILHACPDKEYYMVCLNVKDFKLINNLFGFEKGNELLLHIAKILQTKLPSEAVYGRMENDRFAICIPRHLYSEELLLSCIQQITSLMQDSEYKMKLHAGVYPIAPGETDVSVMCDRANMAISTVKNNYDSTIAFYDTKDMERVMQEKYLLGEFETALAGNQFVMFLQPQVTPDGKPIGAEALVRWNHPERGMIPPYAFIELFERAGLIHKLDLYIWEQAAKKLSEWKKSGQEDLHISVNISVKDFYYLDIYKTFTELVEKYEIPPSRLKLEITETALMLEQDKMLILLEKLQSYGFSVEIDDFGSGYSSLNMLKDIPADVLKIDMGFLRETQNHERTKIILGMIVELAKQLNMAVITEGVETETQLAYLLTIGCDMFQGYYFERPISVQEFESKYL